MNWNGLFEVGCRIEYQTTIFREEATSVVDDFQVGRTSVLVELEFRDVGFCGGTETGEPGEPGEKPSEQPTYGTGPESNPGRIGRG